jgi:cytoskeleton protein RodZ
MKFGESLRKERELRGITLEDISAHTKVNTRFLEALEHDDFSVLPAKAFAKGFLRSYAKMVGLDEDLVLTNFEYCHYTIQTGDPSEVKVKYSSGSLPHTFIFGLLFLMILALAAVIVLYYQGRLPLP